MYDELVGFIRKIYSEDFIPLHRPLFSESEKNYLNQTIDSTFVSSVGEYVNLFEDKMSEYTGATCAVPVVNGTAALHLALKVMGVEAGDLVLTQSFTFVATCNAIKYLGADPCFVDISQKTLNIDPVKLESFLSQNFSVQNEVCIHKQSKKKLKALVVMHTFGHVAELKLIKEVCERFCIKLIEDAAEALGSWYHGVHAGLIGDIGILSFNGNKIITTGGGGAILTRDIELGSKIKHLSTTAKVAHKWSFVHDEIGYNYRMPNLNAALGCAQVEKLSFYIKEKRELAKQYKNFFSKQGSDAAIFIEEPEGCTSNYWLNAILLSDKNERDKFLSFMTEKAIQVRPAWNPMHTLKLYQDCFKDNLDSTEFIFDRLVNIPSSVPSLEGL